MTAINMTEDVATDAVTLPEIVVSNTVVRFENVLEPAEVAILLERTCAARDRFERATVIQGDPSVRQAEVLYDITPVTSDFELSLEACMPLVQRLFPELGETWTTELQLTAHGDGGYFGLHTDSGSPETAGRTLSFVYYFTQEPVQFSGGELVLYDSPLGRPGCISPSRQVVLPQCNSMVFFRSSTWHEVCPVASPSEAFEHRRLTINGWLSASSPNQSGKESGR